MDLYIRELCCKIKNDTFERSSTLWYKGLSNQDCKNKPQMHKYRLQKMISNTGEYIEICMSLLVYIKNENENAFEMVLEIVEQEFNEIDYLYPLHIPQNVVTNFLKFPMTKKQQFLYKKIRVEEMVENKECKYEKVWPEVKSLVYKCERIWEEEMFKIEEHEERERVHKRIRAEEEKEQNNL
jgi:hypothetical protein